MIVVGVIIALALASILVVKVRSGPASGDGLNANEPDVFANPDADLDPESDTGEPEGWN